VRSMSHFEPTGNLTARTPSSWQRRGRGNTAFSASGSRPQGAKRTPSFLDMACTAFRPGGAADAMPPQASTHWPAMTADGLDDRFRAAHLLPLVARALRLKLVPEGVVRVEEEVSALLPSGAALGSKYLSWTVSVACRRPAALGASERGYVNGPVTEDQSWATPRFTWTGSRPVVARLSPAVTKQPSETRITRPHRLGARQ
jgi:hypothetical protein